MYYKFMEEALKEADISLMMNEVPVGAVIVKDEKIISRGHNLRETLKDPSAHAEMIAIRKACAEVGDWRLNGCELYVTLEPCPMCAGAILQSRISRVFIGTFDPEAGACGSVVNVVQNDNLHGAADVRWIYDERCSRILEDFFKSRRKNK